MPRRIDSPGGGAAPPSRERALAVAEPSGLGRDLADLLGTAGPAGPTYCYALAHPRAPSWPELRARVAEIFRRLPDVVGRRQVAMGLRAVDGARAGGFFGLLKSGFFHGGDRTGVSAREFIPMLDEWIRWFRSGRASPKLKKR